jgi:hypothetical protein
MNGSGPEKGHAAMVRGHMGEIRIWENKGKTNRLNILPSFQRLRKRVSGFGSAQAGKR